MANQNPYNQLLIEYVKQLQKHNDIEVEIPQVNIDDVIDETLNEITNKTTKLITSGYGNLDKFQQEAVKNS